MKTSVFIFLVLCIQSCSTIESVNHPKEYKEKICIKKKTDAEVWTWVKRFFTDNNFDIIENRETDKYMAGQRGASLTSWGEYLGVMVLQRKDEVEVSFKSAKKLQTTFFATDWEEEFRKQARVRYLEDVLTCM